MDYFSVFNIFCGFCVFLVFVVSVLRSTLVERFDVSRTRDFFVPAIVICLDVFDIDAAYDVVVIVMLSCCCYCHCCHGCCICLHIC